MKTLGEVGYEKWRSLLPPHATAGLPAWSQLPERGQAGWQEVAEVIVEQAIVEIRAHWQDEK